jgi:hypothetical protein
MGGAETELNRLSFKRRRQKPRSNQRSGEKIMKNNFAIRSIRNIAAALVMIVAGTVAAFADVPANDNFSNALDLGTTSVSHVVGLNGEATKESGEPNHGFNPGGRSVWYKWTAPNDRPTQITLVRSNFNTLLAVYTGTSVDNLVLVTGSNDISSENLKSLVGFRPEAGTTYYIAVDGLKVGALPVESGLIRFDLAPVISRSSSDRDRDGRTDISVFRPSDGKWYTYESANDRMQVVKWGMDGDIPVVGDYSSLPGYTDFCVFRPSTGVWYKTDIVDLVAPTAIAQYGLAGDIPVSGTFTGDGNGSDFALFRPADGNWYFRSIFSSSIPRQLHFGQAGDIPVPGDYTPDGGTDIAVYRPSTGVWYILPVNGSLPPPNEELTIGDVYSVQFGLPGDKPVPGDYDGDGMMDPAIFRPSTGYFWVLRSSDDEQHAFRFGSAGDIPVAGEYDGDGKSDFAVFRPSTGDWYIYESSTQQTRFQHFGLPGDIPVVSNVR